MGRAWHATIETHMHEEVPHADLYLMIPISTKLKLGVLELPFVP